MANFSDEEAGILGKLQKKPKAKKKSKGLVPFRSGLGKQESEKAKGLIPLRSGPSKEVSEQPSLIKQSIKKDSKKASKAIDSLQEGMTGEKTTKNNKMSDDMKSALIAGLPVLIGGLLGGEEGLGIGAEAGLKGLAAESKEKSAESKAKLEEDKLQATKDMAAEEIAVKRESLASRENVAQATARIKALKGEPLTEAQSKSRIFGARAAQAEEEFTSLIGGSFDPTSRFSAAAAFLPENLRTEERQRFEQGKRNFLNAVLRKESGARISEEELDVGELQYFPKAGDSQGVVAQKARNRKLVTDLLLEEGKVDLNNPKIRRNFTKTTRLQQIQAIKQRRGL